MGCRGRAITSGPSRSIPLKMVPSVQEIVCEAANRDAANYNSLRKRKFTLPAKFIFMKREINDWFSSGWWELPEPDVMSETKFSQFSTFFPTGKAPLFSKDDDRVRLIPFLTRRPTFNEVQRVFKVLTSLQSFDVNAVDNDDADGKIVVGKSGFPKSPPKSTVKKTTVESDTLSAASSQPKLQSQSTANSFVNHFEKIVTRRGKDDEVVDSRTIRRRRRHRVRQGDPRDDDEHSSADDGDTDDGDGEEDDDDDDVGRSLEALSLCLESLDTSCLKEFDCDLGFDDDRPSGGGGRKRNRRKNKTNSASHASDNGAAR